MKIKFLATNKEADYEFEGETVTINGEVIDLSEFPKDGIFEGVEGDTDRIIRNVERTDDLYVTLCQSPPIMNGDWTESDWIDSNDYDPNELYIKEVGNEN